jgi:DNA-directed RNA polymerase beta' subunit
MPSRLGALLNMKTTSLEKVIYFQDYVVIDPGDTPLRQTQLLTEEEAREAMYKYGEDTFEIDMGAEAVKKLDQAEHQLQVAWRIALEELGGDRVVAEGVDQHAPEDRAVGADEAAHELERRPQHVERAQLLARRRQLGRPHDEERVHVLVDRLQQRPQERLAAREVVMEHAEVHARRVGDLAHREPCAAAAREELTARREQCAIEVPAGARWHGA